MQAPGAWAALVLQHAHIHFAHKRHSIEAIDQFVARHGIPGHRSSPSCGAKQIRKLSLPSPAWSITSRPAAGSIEGEHQAITNEGKETAV